MKSVNASSARAFARSGLRAYVKRFRDFWDSYRSSKLGLLGLGILSFFIIIALVAPNIAPYNPSATSRDVLKPPNLAHLLGTNEVGQDILSQVLYGSQGSLIVGFAASAVSSVIGSLIGLTAGYYEGWPEDTLMRLTDFFLVIPALALMIVLAAVIGSGLLSVILAIGMVGWTGTA